MNAGRRLTYLAHEYIDLCNDISYIPNNYVSKIQSDKSLSCLNGNLSGLLKFGDVSEDINMVTLTQNNFSSRENNVSTRTQIVKTLITACFLNKSWWKQHSTTVIVS